MVVEDEIVHAGCDSWVKKALRERDNMRAGHPADGACGHFYCGRDLAFLRSIASWCALILPVGGCNLTISFSKPGPEFVGGMERAESSRCGASRDVFLELLGFRVGQLILANQA